MKVEHKTEKGTISFILAPKDASGYKLKDNTLTFDVMYGIGKVYHDVLSGNLLIGLTSEVTEEQAKMMVVQSIHTGLFMHHNGIDNIYCYKTAIESFKSIEVHNGVKYPSVVLFKPNEHEK